MSIGSSETHLLWRHAAAVVLLCALWAIACSRAKAEPRALQHLRLPDVGKVDRYFERLEVAPLTAALRAKGFHECNPPDPVGLGPYAPYQRLSLGRILIPQKGGHTPDMGYDVLIHFHGAEAMRKLVVQVARGLVLVLVDKGVGGGPYARALASPAAFPQLRRSIEGALKRHSGSDKAHIRRLAVSSWSAGSVAIGKILEQRHSKIDAYVILDGLHGAWREGARHEPDPNAIEPRIIQREIDLAKRARQGETVFVLTYSQVEPGSYPSTSTTASLLLRKLGMKPKRLDPRGNPFGQISALDVDGLHVWGFGGKNELAHCSQIFLMPRIVTEILEPAWRTPTMDRKVSPTPLPSWARKRRKRR